MRNYLFVYGTLRRGCQNEQATRLARAADFFGAGRVPGRIYRLRRPGLEFPGLVAAEGPEEWVFGDVFRLRQPDITFRHLDEYEGEQFERDIAEVDLDGGGTRECWIYRYTGSTGGAERIADGRWRLGR